MKRFQRLILAGLLLGVASPGYFQSEVQTADQLVQEGTSYFAEENFHQAEYCFRKALALQGNHAGALCGLGEVSLSKGLLAEAEGFFRGAIALDSTQARAYEGIGYLKYETKALDSAAAYLARAVQLVPHNIDLRIFLGMIFKELKDGVNAAAHAREALKVNPGCREAIQLLHELGMAVEEKIEDQESFDELGRKAEEIK